MLTFAIVWQLFWIANRGPSEELSPIRHAHPLAGRAGSAGRTQDICFRAFSISMWNMQICIFGFRFCFHFAFLLGLEHRVCPFPTPGMQWEIKDYNDGAGWRMEEIGHYNLHFSAGPGSCHTRERDPKPKPKPPCFRSINMQIRTRTALVPVAVILLQHCTQCKGTLNSGLGIGESPPLPPLPLHSNFHHFRK